MPLLARWIDGAWINRAARSAVDRPLVSVLVVCRNQPSLAAGSVGSVLAQSYPSIECVLVDDGSGPDARTQIEQALPKDDRLRVISRPWPLGTGSALNAGLAEARGDWIVPMLAGEQLDRHAIWRLVRSAEQAGALGAVANSNRPMFFNAAILRAVGWFATDMEQPQLFAELLDRWRTAGHVLTESPDVRAKGAAPDPEAMPKADVLFMPHNAYHTREMAAVAAELETRGIGSLFVDITNCYADEDSGHVMRELGLLHARAVRDILDRVDPGVLFVMNDWSPPVHDRVIDCRARRTTSMALVEGVQDYEDTHVEHLGIGVHRSAYKHAGIALLVGAHDLKFFEGRDARVTGSTRIEQLAFEPKPASRPRRVVINSNFTYGLYTQDQPQWLASAVGACEQLGVEHVISRHQADAFDFSGLPVSGRPLYEELRECRVLVSRFSGVLLEAMALGVAVVYHNPHGERIDKFLDPKGAYPITTTQQELADAIESLLAEDTAVTVDRQQAFFDRHVSVTPGQPSWVRIADEIERELQTLGRTPIA